MFAARLNCLKFVAGNLLRFPGLENHGSLVWTMESGGHSFEKVEENRPNIRTASEIPMRL